MQEVFDKIIKKLEERSKEYNSGVKNYGKWPEEMCTCDAIEIVKQEAEEYNNGWISCSERMPEVETKVLIFAKRKYKDGGVRNIVTTAMYEDGTMSENDSNWRWEDIDGEWDEENDCYIIPEGWWEDKIYNYDGELNNAVDDKVIAWQPLPQPYKPKGE